jgi:hypothetical protein
MDWGWWASRSGLSKPVSAVAPFFDEFLNPASQEPPQRWVTLRTGGSFPPVPMRLSKRDEVEKVRLNVALWEIYHCCTTSPKTGWNRVKTQVL